MKPSERINLIKGISKALENESWTLIDLTLRQFGLPWSSTGGSDKGAYVIDMIGDAKDPVLVDLAKHVGVVTALEAPESASFWDEDQPRLFISHLSASKKSATALKEALAEYGIACFVAHEDIEPTAEWLKEIELGLTSMDALTAILAPGFSESKWTDQEVGVAIGRRVPILLLRNGLDPYGLMGKFQALQVKGRSADDVATDVITLLAAKPQIATKISRALIQRLKKSGSFARSKHLMGLIEKCHHFTPDAIAALKAAVDENVDVGSAWGVPERIEKIVEAHGG